MGRYFGYDYGRTGILDIIMTDPYFEYHYGRAHILDSMMAGALFWTL